MSVKLYVGNIPWRTSVDELRDLFAAYGNVEVGGLFAADLGVARSPPSLLRPGTAPTRPACIEMHLLARPAGLLHPPGP